MKLPHALTCALAALLVLAPGCKSTRAEEREPQRYTFIFLVSGGDKTQRTPEERGKLFQGHMQNLQRLADESKLYVAGPFGHPIFDDTLRGICILATESYDEARGWMAVDPTVQADVMRAEGGAFETEVPLARALELERAANEAAKQSGKPRKMEESIRPYVMLLAKDAARAEHAVRSSHARDELVFAGRLAASPRASWIAVLDAKSVGEAQQLFGGTFADLGACEVVPWHATTELAKLAPAAPSH